MLETVFVLLLPYYTIVGERRVGFDYQDFKSKQECEAVAQERIHNAGRTVVYAQFHCVEMPTFKALTGQDPEPREEPPNVIKDKT